MYKRLFDGTRQQCSLHSVCGLLNSSPWTCHATGVAPFVQSPEQSPPSSTLLSFPTCHQHLWLVNIDFDIPSVLTHTCPDHPAQSVRACAAAPSYTQPQVLDSLTGIPRPDDVLLFAVPVCGPYNSLQVRAVAAAPLTPSLRLVCTFHLIPTCQGTEQPKMHATCSAHMYWGMAGLGAAHASPHSLILTLFSLGVRDQLRVACRWLHALHCTHQIAKWCDQVRQSKHVSCAFARRGSRRRQTPMLQFTHAHH